MICNPTNGKLRTDGWGDGAYGAMRTTIRGGSRVDRPHLGEDVTGAPGSYVVSPVDGQVVRTGMPYATDNGAWNCYLLIREADGTEWRLFYVIPLPGIVGQTVRRGQAVAVLADIGQKYGTQAGKGRMQPHCHVEKWQAGERVPPDVPGVTD